ncbi:MAG TPA: GIY-YIG nuclease family protein [Pyrinomonadaceae bacterium]|nr:GIY-YIG nuclease family protein [Pyrinomonadaceae bacterium]
MSKGIYSIRNSITGERYIGSSVNIDLRFTQHKTALNKRCHPNKKLQLAWGKYGFKNFEFTVIEEVTDCENKTLVAREQYWIDYYDSYKNGYNSTPIAARPLTLTDEERSIRKELVQLQKNIGKYEPQYIKKVREQNPLRYDIEKQHEWETNYTILKEKFEKKRKRYGWAGIIFFSVSLTACAIFKLQIAFFALIPVIIITSIIYTWGEWNWDEIKEVEPKAIAQQEQNKLVQIERNKRKRYHVPYEKRYRVSKKLN